MFKWESDSRAAQVERMKREQKALLDEQLREQGRSVDDGISVRSRGRLHNRQIDYDEAPAGGLRTSSVAPLSPTGLPLVHSALSVDTPRRGFGRTTNFLQNEDNDLIARRQEKQNQLNHDLDVQRRERDAENLVAQLKKWDEDADELKRMGYNPAVVGKPRPSIPSDLVSLVQNLAPGIILGSKIGPPKYDAPIATLGSPTHTVGTRSPVPILENPVKSADSYGVSANADLAKIFGTMSMAASDEPIVYKPHESNPSVATTVAHDGSLESRLAHTEALLAQLLQKTQVPSVASNIGISGGVSGNVPYVQVPIPVSLLAPQVSPMIGANLAQTSGSLASTGGFAPTMGVPANEDLSSVLKMILEEQREIRSELSRTQSSSSAKPSAPAVKAVSTRHGVEQPSRGRSVSVATVPSSHVEKRRPPVRAVTPPPAKPEEIVQTLLSGGILSVSGATSPPAQRIGSNQLKSPDNIFRGHSPSFAASKLEDGRFHLDGVDESARYAPSLSSPARKRATSARSAAKKDSVRPDSSSSNINSSRGSVAVKKKAKKPTFGQPTDSAKLAQERREKGLQREREAAELRARALEEFRQQRVISKQEKSRERNEQAELRKQLTFNRAEVLKGQVRAFVGAADVESGLGGNTDFMDMQAIKAKMEGTRGMQGLLQQRDESATYNSQSLRNNSTQNNLSANSNKLGLNTSLNPNPYKSYSNVQKNHEEHRDSSTALDNVGSKGDNDGNELDAESRLLYVGSPNNGRRGVVEPLDQRAVQAADSAVNRFFQARESGRPIKPNRTLAMSNVDNLLG